MKKSKKKKQTKLPKQRDMATLALIISGKGGAHGTKKAKKKQERKKVKQSLRKEGF